MSSTELVTIPANGVDTYRMSTDAANICGAIVKQTARNIQGKNYVQVEGWMAIALAHGCAASACNVERIEGGFRATGQVRRMDTGGVIAEAEGFVGEDEPTWFGGVSRGKTLPKRPDFAIRAMAQTRAISRACRSAFAHVVVMIDKNLGTTPAEEMQGVYEHDPDSVPQRGYVHADAAQEAVKDGLATSTQSTYDVEKLKKAIAADWLVTNTTDKGKISQVSQYLDMARDEHDVAKILSGNVAVIEGAGEAKAAEINEDADRLLRYFEEQAAKARAA